MVGLDEEEKAFDLPPAMHKRQSGMLEGIERISLYI